MIPADSIVLEFVSWWNNTYNNEKMFMLLFKTVTTKKKINNHFIHTSLEHSHINETYQIVYEKFLKQPYTKTGHN